MAMASNILSVPVIAWQMIGVGGFFPDIQIAMDYTTILGGSLLSIVRVRFEGESGSTLKSRLGAYILATLFLICCFDRKPSWPSTVSSWVILQSAMAWSYFGACHPSTRTGCHFQFLKQVSCFRLWLSMLNVHHVATSTRRR